MLRPPPWATDSCCCWLADCRRQTTGHASHGRQASAVVPRHGYGDWVLVHESLKCLKSLAARCWIGRKSVARTLVNPLHSKVNLLGYWISTQVPFLPFLPFSLSAFPAPAFALAPGACHGRCLFGRRQRPPDPRTGRPDHRAGGSPQRRQPPLAAPPRRVRSSRRLVRRRHPFLRALARLAVRHRARGGTREAAGGPCARAPAADRRGHGARSAELLQGAGPHPGRDPGHRRAAAPCGAVRHGPSRRETGATVPPGAGGGGVVARGAPAHGPPTHVLPRRGRLAGTQGATAGRGRRAGAEGARGRGARAAAAAASAAL